MTVETIPIVSQEQWHAERAKDVTSTQVAALFGCNPYLTHLELWHQKATGYVEEFDNNDRVRWGNRLEASIAAPSSSCWRSSSNGTRSGTSTSCGRRSGQCASPSTRY